MIPNAKKCAILTLPDGSFKVKVVAPPEKGRANRELVELLASHFAVKKSCVRIIAGEHGRDKVVEIIVQPTPSA